MSLASIVRPDGRHSRRLQRQPDATNFLTVYFALLYFIPSRLVFKPLGGAGSVAGMLAALGLFWWGWHMLYRVGPRRRITVVDKFALALVGCVLLSYVAATTRALSGDQLSAAQQGALAILSQTGVLLAASTGITSPQRLGVLLRRMSLIAGLVAMLGIIQFITGQTLIERLSVPGLTWNAEVDQVSRSGFLRPFGTAAHPLEFGLATSIMLAVSLHVALDPTWRSSAFRRWFPVVALGLVVPLTIARSAIIACTVMSFFLVPQWSPRFRRIAAIIAAFAGIGFFVTVPGLLGAIKSLFTGISDNASIDSRTDSYALAWEFIGRSPIIGRGFGTFNSSYRILDNQYLGFLIDTGFLGLTCLLGLYLAGVIVALRARSMTDDMTLRSLSTTLAATLCASGVSLAFFDGFAFPMFWGTASLLLGLSSLVRKIVAPPGDSLCSVDSTLGDVA